MGLGIFVFSTEAPEEEIKFGSTPSSSMNDPDDNKPPQVQLPPTVQVTTKPPVPVPTFKPPTPKMGRLMQISTYDRCAWTGRKPDTFWNGPASTASTKPNDDFQMSELTLDLLRRAPPSGRKASKPSSRRDTIS
jgi:hypothetical protein